MNRDKDVGELLLLARNDPDVRMMVSVVCDTHGCDLVVLAEQHPVEFDRLYDAAYSMIAQLGEHQQ